VERRPGEQRGIAILHRLGAPAGIHTPAVADDKDNRLLRHKPASKADARHDASAAARRECLSLSFGFESGCKLGVIVASKRRTIPVFHVPPPLQPIRCKICRTVFYNTEGRCPTCNCKVHPGFDAAPLFWGIMIVFVLLLLTAFFVWERISQP
jgi:hypothetical protein